MTIRPTARTALIAAALFVVAGLCAGAVKVSAVPAGAAAPSGEVAEATAACEARIAEAESSVAATLARLNEARSADRAGRCAAYRSHAKVLGESAEAYGACLTGFARDEAVAQFETAEADWTAVIGDVCAAPAEVIDANL